MALGDHMHTDMTEGAAQPFARRGACPTLSRPMPTGDGLLARLRPKNGILTISPVRKLARAAARYGNGLLEITARGSLQIRGLTSGNGRSARHGVDAAGIVVLPSPVIELPPLHGAGFGDVATLLKWNCNAKGSSWPIFLRSPGLAPKLAIIIDGGGHFGLADVTADIRLLACPRRDMAGRHRRRRTERLPDRYRQCRGAILAVTRLLNCCCQSAGRSAVAISRRAAAEVFPRGSASLAGQPAGEAAGLGMHQSADGTVVVGLRPRFGQMSANDLLAFLASVRALGSQGDQTGA
jgi:precorrin-3B synthase